MTRIAFACASARVLFAIGLAPGFTQVQAAESKRSVSAVLESLQEESYIGGMPPVVSQLATNTRLQLQSSREKPLPTCEALDSRQGSVVATGVGVDPPGSELQADPLLKELQVLLRHQRPFVRDAAAYVIGEIGPAAKTLEPDLSGENIDRSAWFTHALGRISCQSYAMSGGLEFVPEEARSKLIGSDNASLSLGLKIQLLARLLESKQLHWPDGFFSSFIDEWELREESASLDQIKPDSVLAIVDHVMDESVYRSLRDDLLELLGGIGKAAIPASDQLWKLANGPDDDLAFSAAHVVMGAGGVHSLRAASLLLQRFQVDLSMLPKDLCSAPDAAELLGPHVKRRLDAHNWSEAGNAATWLGCLDPLGNAALLRAHLNHPSWETQIAVIAALSISAQSDPSTQQALRKVRSTHWSGLVRRNAGESLDPPSPEQGTSDEQFTISFKCFHRCLTDHLRRCGDEDGIVDGLYVSPTMGELDIEWERARRVPTPDAFPIEVDEDSRPGYGTSTYLRVEDGWLYGTDRWHYDGMIGFVDNQGRESEMGEWGEDVVAFVDTPHFGPVMLGGSIFAVGDAGLMSEVERVGGEWKLVPRVALPSPPWGWAIAPNGTLLVADPYEAVAVLADGRIESLACPARTPADPPRSLLAMAKKSPRAPSARAQRDANDALVLDEATFAAQKSRIQKLERDPSQRQVWETPENQQGWLNRALDELLNAFLKAGRAEDALRTLEAIAGDVATASPGRRFQVYAAANQPERARMVSDGLADAEDVDALKLHAMLALADGRSADAKTAINRIGDLAEKSSVQQSDDPYLPLLHGLIAKKWPETDLSADDANAWPGPIREYLAGRSNEKALVLASHTRDGRVDREKLCEALFFNGLKLVLEGKSQRARAQFRAAAALQVQHFHEHAVAMTVLGDPLAH